MWKFSVTTLPIILCVLHCLQIVLALPAENAVLEKAEKKAKKHTDLANKYSAKSVDTYKKFQKSCLGTCFYGSQIAYFDSRYDSHNKKASAARNKVNDLKGVPRRKPTPIVDEVAQQDSGHPHSQAPKMEAQHPSTLSQEIMSAKSSSPSHLSSSKQSSSTHTHMSRTLGRGKAPAHSSRR